MNNNIQETTWSENVILVDADYVDKVAFNLIVNFERIIGRPIPQADFARWIDCVALDGGVRSEERGTRSEEGGTRSEGQETLVVLVHRKESLGMKNFVPGNYAQELNGQAFRDHLGEFVISAYPVETLADGEDYFTEALQLICTQPSVKRVMVIPNADDEHIYNKVRETLRRLDAATDGKRITVFAMQPMPGGSFRQEILGYSLMAALGISANEIKQQQ